MRRYEKIINELQTLLREMTQKRIECLKRNISGIIPERGLADLFSSQERQGAQERPIQTPGTDIYVYLKCGGRLRI